MPDDTRTQAAPEQRFCSWLSTGDTDTINDVIRRAAERWPDRVYLDFSGETWTYDQVYRRALAYAAGLAEAGVRWGDTVATVLDNHIDAVTLWFGINFLGAVSVPVNTANRGEFLRHQLDDSAAKIVVADPVMPKGFSTSRTASTTLRHCCTGGTCRAAQSPTFGSLRSLTFVGTAPISPHTRSAPRIWPY